MVGMQLWLSGTGMFKEGLVNVFKIHKLPIRKEEKVQNPIVNIGNRKYHIPFLEDAVFSQ